MVLWAFTLLALGGLAVLPDRRAAPLFAAILLIYPLPYYVVNWSSRYRFPIEWILVLLAAAATVRMIERIAGAAVIRNQPLLF